ncbi:MAG: uracil-DNA glycosylase family protein [Candidatus Dojkabacteria bacterium]|jgi:uracil-DNA glycosylase|nr:uracil-DNA glycosylase family protein [Candidatus Dojkabacteria bacterium]
MTKREQLLSIFNSIFQINVCGKDSKKVRRDISKTNVDSKIIIIAEAMAPEQVRLSGVNYFYKDGSIGNTGRSLEKFLKLFDYSVYPNSPNCIYHTEIVHSFPGYDIKNGKKSIRRPNLKEIEKSVESGILEREIEIIKPQLIFLMGDTAYQTFYKYFLRVKPKRTLTSEIEYISKTGNYQKYQGIALLPLQHSSGANPRFSSILRNMELLNLIKKILDH